MHLSDYLDQRGIAGADFADRIGVTQQAVSQYVLRQRVPKAEIMRRIMVATDGAVTANDFVAPPPAKPAEAAR